MARRQQTDPEDGYLDPQDDYSGLQDDYSEPQDDSRMTPYSLPHTDRCSKQLQEAFRSIPKQATFDLDAGLRRYDDSMVECLKGGK